MTTQLVPDGDAGALADRAEESGPIVLDAPVAGPGHASTTVALDEILPTPAAVAPRAAAVPPVAGVRTARLTGLTGRRAKVTLRGHTDPIDAAVAPEVDPSVVADALANGDSVLLEIVPGEAPLVVGVLHTRRPRAIRLKASTIEIDADEEVLVRSGRGALRIRADGDIEVVGSRISAASRGLFKIVGRLLRLN